MNIRKNCNNKGFTLIELLATISILAIIMLIAIPNVVGVVQRSRNNTYVEDAKKMVALAKYKVKADTKTKESLQKDESVCLPLSELDTSNEIKDAPNGGEYVNDKSWVKITKSNDAYTYSVTLIEKKNNNYQGLNEISSKDLSKDSAHRKVSTIKSSDLKSCSS